jgi:hypothetical protein
MKLVDGDETVVLVTGSSVSATTKDVPLAQWLAAEIDRRGLGQAYRRAVVIGDRGYVHTPAFHGNPTIGIGGPGSNDVVQHLSQTLPTVWNRDDRSFVQMSMDGRNRQVALWGMDSEATRHAVEAFVEEGMLDALLTRLWPFRPTTFV